MKKDYYEQIAEQEEKSAKIKDPEEPRVNIDDTHYIVAIVISGNLGHYKVYSHDGNFNNEKLISETTIDNSSCYNRLWLTDDNHYCVVYPANDTHAKVNTYEYDETGNATLIDSNILPIR